MARSLHVSRALARAGPTIGPDSKATHVRTDGRLDRCSNDELARTHWRLPKLGLSVQLASRRRLHGLRLSTARISVRGGGLHGLASELRREARPESTAAA